MAPEKILELVCATRGGHVLLSGNARDRAFMQPECFCDFAKYHRSHRNLAVLEKVALAIDNSLRNPQNRVKALLDVLDQPAGLLQLTGHRIRPIAVTGKKRRIKSVDAKPR